MRVLGVYPGVTAPDFEATTLDGQPFKLSGLRGKVVLIDFWASWCAPCVAELPTVKQAREEHATAGFEVVSISFDRSAEAARKFIEAKQMRWVNIWAEKADEGALAELYGVSAIPATFLVGPDGVVVEKDLRGEPLRNAIRKQMSLLKRAR